MASGEVQANPTVNMFENDDVANDGEPQAAPIDNDDENMIEGLGATNND